MNTSHFFILLFLVSQAAVWDLFTGKIPNVLTLGGCIIGLAWTHFSSLNPAWSACFWGALLPILLFLPFFYFRMIGAGDIKLFSMIGVLSGPIRLLWIMLGSFLLAGVFCVLRLMLSTGRESKMQWRAVLWELQERYGYLGKYLLKQHERGVIDKSQKYVDTVPNRYRVAMAPWVLVALILVYR